MPHHLVELPKSPYYVDPTEEENKGRGLGNTGAF